MSRRAPADGWSAGRASRTPTEPRCPPTPHPPNRVSRRSVVPSGRPGGPGLCVAGRRFPGLSAEMAAQAGHCHLNLGAHSEFKGAHSPVARDADGHDRQILFLGRSRWGYSCCRARSRSTFDALRTTLLPRMPSQPSISTRGLFPATTGSHGVRPLVNQAAALIIERVFGRMQACWGRHRLWSPTLEEFTLTAGELVCSGSQAVCDHETTGTLDRCRARAVPGGTTVARPRMASHRR